MAGFRFRLETVLEWYRKQCDLEKERLSKCLANLNEAREARTRLELERARIEREVIAQPAIPSTDLASLGLYRLGAKKRFLEYCERITGLEIAAAEQTNKYLAAQRRQKLVEQLRERRRLEHVYAETRELEALAGESFLGQWSKRLGPATPAEPPERS
jgi:flagellar biosynthesis chaperone FliJ